VSNDQNLSPSNEKTLRDEFALAATECDIDAAIPHSLEECEKIRGLRSGNWGADHQLKMRAWARYAHADAMLEARKK